MENNRKTTTSSSLTANSSQLTASSGFTVLFAVLMGTLLFSIGISIAHLSLKEVVLSAAAKESEQAFFAADSGIECALYWDRRVGGVFPDSAGAPRSDSIECNSDDIALEFRSETAAAATTAFRLTFSPRCADVTVKKTIDGSTVIESRGRNDCGVGLNPARVERALRALY